MKTDIVELRNYYEKPIGSLTRDLVNARLCELWGEARGQSVLGFGYADPYLNPFLNHADRVISVMPAAQGVAVWPDRDSVRVCLADEAGWPLPDASVDRIIVAHGLEEAESPRRLLREIWRVLVDDGRVVVVAPNRRGLWAQFDHTPFGHGRPYSRNQLTRLLEECLFAPTAWSQSLHMPPIGLRFMLRSAPAWERAGERLWPAFAGVVMVEAAKELYGARLAPDKRLLQANACGRWATAMPSASSVAAAASARSSRNGGAIS